MTERGRAALTRTEAHLSIGPSSLTWQDGSLLITIDERCAPIPRRLRGTVRITPTAFPGMSFPLDAAGCHHWQPIAPRTAIAVDFEQPALRWTGEGYHDSNFGAEPLQRGFRQWTWSRAHLATQSIVLYDAQRRDGSEAAMALAFDADGKMHSLTPPPTVALAKSGWRLARGTRADEGAAVSVSRSLEDAPFYARSLIETRLFGESAVAVHESLCLQRFGNGIVRAMLPFRMPRRFA